MGGNMIELNLLSLMNKDNNSISGRLLGLNYCNDNVINNLKVNNFVIIIPNDIVAISDSFWKGFFILIFKYFKTKEEILNKFVIVGDDYFKDCIEKNLIILEEIISN